MTEALRQTGGYRFVARETDIRRADGRIVGWQAAVGGQDASTSEPNTGNSALVTGGRPALVFREGVNCGFVLPGFAGTVSRFTAAVIYASAGEAKTLVSVSTGQANNQIFVNETQGNRVAMDRAGTASILQPRAEGPSTDLVLLSYSGQTMALRSRGRTDVIPVKLPGMAHIGDFFIGCRSNRTGLAKTQGNMRLHEVFFWPDSALIGASAPEEAGALAALDRYFRWTYLP